MPNKALFLRIMKKLINIFTITGILLTNQLMTIVTLPSDAYADDLLKDTVRYAGSSRTAPRSRYPENWFEAYNVVLAREKLFPTPWPAPSWPTAVR
jgi:hypothetical protein